MSRTLKVTGNHVVYDHGVWFLRVIMSSSRALCCLPSVKKQKHDSMSASEETTHKTQKGQQRCQRSCLLVTWKRKNWENLRYFYTFRNKLSVPLTVVTVSFHSMYNKTITRFGFCHIQNNQGLGKGYQPPLNPFLDLDDSGYHKHLIQ